MTWSVRSKVYYSKKRSFSFEWFFVRFCAAICHQVLDIYGERDSDEKKSESVSTVVLMC